METIDLNADLAEGVTDDVGLLALVTSANVACGYHAGEAAIMRQVCEEAVMRNVVVGARVSYDDRENFGRRHPARPAGGCPQRTVGHRGPRLGDGALRVGRLGLCPR